MQICPCSISIFRVQQSVRGQTCELMAGRDLIGQLTPSCVSLRRGSGWAAGAGLKHSIPRVVAAVGAGDLVESSWLLLGVGQGSSAHLVSTLPECNLHLNAKTRTWLHDQKRNVMTCHSSSRFELLLSPQSTRYGHKKMKLIVFSYRRQTSTDHKEQQQAPDSFPQHRSGYQLKLEIKYISTVVRKPVCAKQLANNMQGGRIC